ncbi:hypothetical protein CPT_Sycamore_044 [Streptomyces phage Sycamore]|uniref:Uncharacterized protein n=1 Tax=Streptomyces phage Sycamore TaxID=2767589 RepID=A0A873WVI6_9CAUD|nr:hypothetical protein CPT_Sycamore_044 [Streptomyces phage Sycamore]
MDFFDNISGAPCLNCETDAALPGDLFCHPECRDEYNGEGAYAE